MRKIITLTAEKGNFQMESVKTIEGEFLGKLYKNVKMGADSIIKLLPKMKEGELKRTLTDQLDGYQHFVSETEEKIERLGEVPKDENAFTKFRSGVGITMNTLMDSTDSHIAQIMIEGMTMGVTDTLKVMREYKGQSSDDGIMKIASEIVNYQEKCIETLKKYL